jgi:hypothetical protein
MTLDFCGLQPRRKKQQRETSEHVTLSFAKKKRNPGSPLSAPMVGSDLAENPPV